ncbi:MAG TPA: cytochrome b [Hyphomicrobiaceae bacterium]|nr:cytochrome b [Hyphomicrobiaceae bacterium]
MVEDDAIDQLTGVWDLKFEVPGAGRQTSVASEYKQETAWFFWRRHIGYDVSERKCLGHSFRGVSGRHDKDAMIFNTLYYWGSPAKWLHWIGAAMILFLYLHGLIVVDGEGGVKAANTTQVFVHAATGVTLGLLMLGRYLWRLANKIPMLPAKTPNWEKKIAVIAHIGLYIATFITIFGGWLLAGTLQPAVPVKLFGLIPIPTLSLFHDKGALKALEFVHQLAAHFLIIMVVLHVFAALWHHFIQRDSVLRRMWLRGQNRPRQRQS